MSIRNPISTEEIARLYYEEGLSGRDIGARVGLSRVTVHRRLRVAGYKARYARNTRYQNPKFRASEHPTTHDIAWAAGIYEGEGCCAYRRPKENRGPIINVVQKDPWLCIRLRSLFGGSVQSHRRSTAGRSTIDTFYRWSVTNRRALAFAMTIYKFLSPRRQERIREAIQGERVYAQKTGDALPVS